MVTARVQRHLRPVPSRQKGRAPKKSLDGRLGLLERESRPSCTRPRTCFSINIALLLPHSRGLWPASHRCNGSVRSILGGDPWRVVPRRVRCVVYNNCVPRVSEGAHPWDAGSCRDVQLIHTKLTNQYDRPHSQVPTRRVLLWSPIPSMSCDPWAGWLRAVFPVSCDDAPAPPCPACSSLSGLSPSYSPSCSPSPSHSHHRRRNLPGLLQPDVRGPW